MLEKIIASTLKQKGFIIFISIVLVIAGIYSYYTLPVDAFPDVTNIQVEIISRADGLSAIEIERNVTYPIETEMRGLQNVQQMRSVTKFGLSIVTIIFNDDVDIYFARQLVFERLSDAKENVPDGVEIEMGPIATVMGEIYQYTLEGDIPEDSIQQKAYLTNLRILQDWVIAPQLKSVAGVNEVNSFGGYFKQYQVIISPDKLVSHNIGIDEVFNAIEKNNQNAGGNILEKETGQYIIRGVGMIRNTQNIEYTVLRSNDGTPVYIKDVASVKTGEAVRMGAALKNGENEAVGGIVMMLRGENSRDVVKRVEEKAEEINNNNILPDGIKIIPFYNRKDIIQTAIGTVNRSLLEGALLVLIVLYLLLRSFRGSFVVLIALPLSLLVTFIVMKITGLSANLMSLGGLAISIGMIIDATIIQVENVQRHLSEEKDSGSKTKIVLKAVLEVRKPSIFGELIIAITFIPILTLQGIEGKMFNPLALTVIIALLSSMLLSIFIIPVMCSVFLKKQKEKESVIMKYAKKFYLPVLQNSLKKKTIVVGTASVLLLAAIFIFSILGTEFMPVMDEGAYDMDIALLPGVSLQKAMEINKIASKKIMEFDEVDVIVSRTGQTELALDTRGADKTGYVGILKPKDEWKRNITKEELTNEMREALETIPGIAFGFSQPIQCRIDEIIAGTKAQLIIKLFGDDIEMLKQKADEIVKVLSKIEGTTDLMAEKITGQPYLTIEIDRIKIARYGLNVSDVQNVIKIAVAGASASRFYEENRNFDIVVRLPEEKRNSLETIGEILVSNQYGVNIPLSQLADIKIIEGPVQISRENGLRRIGIEMNIDNRDIGSFVEEAKNEINENVKLPDGYYLTWGGQFENQQRAMNTLKIIGPIAVGLILLLLYLTFRSYRLPLLVLMNLPFALIGGIFSLYISGLYLSVPASVGFIVLFGVAVLNGLVLVSYISQLREDGMDLHKAIITGCMNRLRPVIMTASISVFSLTPMLFASGSGSEIQKPLAVVVIGGLITSTLLTLIVIPAMYGWFEKNKTETANNNNE